MKKAWLSFLLLVQTVLVPLPLLVSTANKPSSVKALAGLVSKPFLSPLAVLAAWALGLLAARTGNAARVRASRAALGTEPSPAPLRGILDAMAAVQGGNFRAGLSALPALPPLNTPGSSSSPLVDAATRFLRAEWQEQSGARGDALRTLIWYEHLQTIGHLTGVAQAGEMGWAVGTLARWKRALLLDPQSSAFERCSAYRAVARLWAGGEPAFAARAGTADSVVRRDCTVSP